MSYFYFCFESINVFIILEDNKKMDHKINVSLEEIYQTIQNVDSYKVLEPKWVSIKQSFKKKTMEGNGCKLFNNLYFLTNYCIIKVQV